MFLDSAKKKEIFEKYGKSATNTGSAESQIALFTVRIAHLTEHLKANHKDHSSERALKMLVGKRRRLLDYLIKVDIERYRAIIKELGISKEEFESVLDEMCKAAKADNCTSTNPRECTPEDIKKIFLQAYDGKIGTGR